MSLNGTQAWVELEYHHRVHSETGQAPVNRYLLDQNVGRPAPDTEDLRFPFTTIQQPFTPQHAPLPDTFQHDTVRAKADRVRYLLVDVRFQLDRVCGKGKGHADFEGSSDLQRIPIPQLERVSTNLLNLMRCKTLAWKEVRWRLEVAPLCANLEKAILELQAEREVLRSAKGAQSHAYAERFRSGAAEERELREQIGVLRSLLRSGAAPKKRGSCAASACVRGGKNPSAGARRRKRRPRRPARSQACCRNICGS